MITPLSDISASGPIDVCIIGAGAAGITIARELLAAGRRVCLIESGDKDYDHDLQQLNDAENVGFDYYKLIDARLRIFGGTTAIWGGRCAPLDPIDFEDRDWVPYSGWPISADDIAPHYRRARRQLGLPEVGAQDDPERRARENFLNMHAHGFEVTRWEFDGKHDRFQLHNARDVIDHPNMTVVLRGTVTNLHLSESGTRIEAATAKDRDGNEATLKAQTFVLAAGGLENPRLMLASRDRDPNGIGNAHGNVGRFFMEHPRARAGIIRTNNPVKLLRASYRMEGINGVRTVSLLRPTDEMQSEARILNHGVTVIAVKPPGSPNNLTIRLYDGMRHGHQPSRLNRILWRSMKNGALWLNRQAEPYISAALVKAGLRDLNIVIRAEQAPNPDSRVFLSDETDAFGMPKIKLDWRFVDIDKDSISVIVDRFDAFLKAQNLGHVQKADWLNDPSKPWEIDPLIGFHPIGGYHHMGTTRMASSPETGVVDGNCKVFGTDNLYVAGCSVFPTGGWGNPTLTIVALAHRLADHLADHLAEQPTA